MSNDTVLAKAAFKKETGCCVACHRPLDTHPQCEACLILCGPKHDYDIETYRNHAICTKCIGEWERLEVTVGREVTWEEYLKPTTSMSGIQEEGNAG